MQNHVPVGMFVALDFVWDKAKENRTEEKAIFVDEVWQLIGASSNRLAAEFVLDIFHSLRLLVFHIEDNLGFTVVDDTFSVFSIIQCKKVV